MLSALRLNGVLAGPRWPTSPACLHTSALLLAPVQRKGRRNGSKFSSSPKTRLAKSLKPTGKAKRLGTLEVAPRSRPSFARDKAPHEGRVPQERIPSRGRRNSEPPAPAKAVIAQQKHFAAMAHSERVERRTTAARERRGSATSPLEEEFDLSPSTSIGGLPKSFASPPLLPGLLQCLRELIGANAKPTAIQALSLKHLFKGRVSEAEWTECLLASETGSGKSIAYLLPLLQDLKRRESGDIRLIGSSRKPSSKPLNPRALVLAPTHELSRQLAGFAKKLSHVIKLRVMCASRANNPSIAKEKGTASKMKRLMETLDTGGGGEIIIPGGGRSSRPVDLLVGTPMKLLELERGRGWNWEQRARERALRINSENRLEQDAADTVDLGRKFWVDEPQMGLESVEWVVVDEADVLFDPDFQEATRTLLADIAAARGRPVPLTPLTALASAGTEETTPQISYPFNFLLTSATIPTSLSNYLSAHHPTLTRLASPRLHHLPRALVTEHASWTGGNKDADIERRIRRVWAEDALVHAKTALGGSGPVKLSKIIVFCNKRRKVEELGGFLDSRGIKCVALTGSAESRQLGSNHHLDGFLRQNSSPSPASRPAPAASSSDSAVTPHVLVTTSLLSRGLDFSPDIKHVFIVDEPRNMIDFLHRAGRTGRAGETGKVVIFGRSKGRGSGRTLDMRKRIGAVAA
ncbi:hypothetical protein ID866_4329 [Astraeus odoratus]|nr:hypothetical protein ID866_4329 [Astraeus odoratus]